MLLRPLAYFLLVRVLQTIRLRLQDIRIAFSSSSIHADEVLTSAVMGRASRLNCTLSR
jgi:hypothetical protein